MREWRLIVNNGSDSKNYSDRVWGGLKKKMNMITKVKIIIKKLLIPFIKPLRNVYKTNYKKSVLLSYITTPFKLANNYGHTNWMECKTAADVFSELGYNVDVIDFYREANIQYDKYDVIYGMGMNLEKSFDVNKKIKRIYYATGCNPSYSNIETLKKSRIFYEKSQMFGYGSIRLTAFPEIKQCILSDKVIVLGNEFVRSTYTRFDEEHSDRYVNLNCFFYKNSNIAIKKDYNKVKRHFVWFGSSGCLHKGLDIAIELFSKRPDLYLHICGANPNEKEFLKYYQPIIDRSPNIINHGFVNIQLKEFEELMNKCCFAIYPTVSEGGAAALLNVMGNGALIPITSERTGLDLPDEIKLVNSNTIEEYSKIIDDYINNYDELKLQKLAELCCDYVCRNYSYDNYRTALKSIIREVVEEK